MGTVPINRERKTHYFINCLKVKKNMSNFYQNTIKPDPRFKSSKLVADTTLLEPKFFSIVQKIVADAQAHGLNLMIYETYRSQARQTILFNEGVSKLKKVGVHHYGLACDLVKSVNGKPSWKGDFSFLGELAYAYGLIWGGDWGNPNIPHSFIDEYHLQRCSIKMEGALFREEWYPDDNYDPYKD
jgi:hypothetical protein